MMQVATIQARQDADMHSRVPRTLLIAIGLAIAFCLFCSTIALSQPWLGLLLGAMVGWVFHRWGSPPGEESISILNGALAVIVVLCGFVWVTCDFSPALNVEKQTTEDAMVFALAFDFAAADMEAGKQLQWPPGKALDSAVAKEDFPVGIVGQAEKHWESIGPGERNRLKLQRAALIEANHELPPGGLTKGAFIGVLWGGVAAASAFVLGGRLIMF